MSPQREPLYVPLGACRQRQSTEEEEEVELEGRQSNVALEVRVVALAVSGAEEDQVALLAEGPAAGAWTWTR